MFASLWLVYCFVDIAIYHLDLYRFAAVIKKHSNTAHLKVNAEKTYRNPNQTHDNRHDK